MTVKMPFYLFDSIDQPVSVADNNYVFIYANAAFRAYFQKNIPDILGSRIQQVTGTAAFNDTLKPCFDACLKGREAGTAAFPVNPGQSINIIQVHFYPYLTDHENIGGVVMICEIQKIPESLSKSQENAFRLIAENSTDIIYTTDLNQQFTYVSPSVEKITGYPVEEVLTLTAKDLMTPRSYQLQLEAFQNMLDNPAGIQDQSEIKTLELIHKDGSVLWGEVHARLLLDHENRPYGVLGICRDVTKRKMLEDELREAKEKAEESERLKTAFLANLSHEIRTPLNIIMGYVQLLDNGALSEQMRKQYIDAINNSSDHLIDIIDDVLSMARLDTGQQTLQVAEFNLNKLILEVYASYEPKANRKKIRFETVIPLQDSESTICSDENKIHQILSNLVNNAFKFSPELGEISFGYSMEEDHIRFFVKDNGIGIADDQHEMIFERFTQVDHSNKRKFEGTGLGLPISQGLVRLLGGSIYVESQLERGTTFYFTVPLGDE